MDAIRTPFDYTVFHIGIYISLGAAIIAANVLWERSDGQLKAVLVLLTLAGMCGGSIASNLPETKASDIHTLLDQHPRIIYDLVPLPRYRDLVFLEHLFFWGAVGIMFCRVLSSGKTKPVPSLEPDVKSDEATLLGRISAKQKEITALRAEVDLVRKQLAAGNSKMASTNQEVVPGKPS